MSGRSWTEENYRMFGLEPDNFTPTQERFYALVHPDDREGLRTVSSRVPEPT